MKESPTTSERMPKIVDLLEREEAAHFNLYDPQETTLGIDAETQTLDSIPPDALSLLVAVPCCVDFAATKPEAAKIDEPKAEDAVPTKEEPKAQEIVTEDANPGDSNAGLQALVSKAQASFHEMARMRDASFERVLACLHAHEETSKQGPEYEVQNEEPWTKQKWQKGRKVVRFDCG